MKEPLHGPHRLTRCQIDSLRVLAMFPRAPVVNFPGSHVPGRTISRHAARSPEAAGLARVWIERTGSRSVQWAELTCAGTTAVEDYRTWTPVAA